MRPGFEHVLDQLLGNGTCTTGTSTAGHILGNGEKSLKINAKMLIEAYIFGTDQRFDEDWFNFTVLNRSSVFLEEFTNELTVRTVNL